MLFLTEMGIDRTKKIKCFICITSDLVFREWNKKTTTTEQTKTKNKCLC